jgi:hypothetical protein
VSIGSPLEVGLAVGAALVLISAAVFTYFKLRRKKDPAQIERLRRLSVGQRGRIIPGEVIGLIEPEGKSTALLLVYRYDVAGVTYEVTQDVSSMPAVAAQATHLVGRGISVKYDVKHPTNSIAACEVWSGISGINPGELEANNALPASAEGAERS